MTIRIKPTKKERIEHNFDNFDRKVGKLLDYYNAGMQDNVRDYLVDNAETFARAWLDEYKVEEVEEED